MDKVLVNKKLRALAENLLSGGQFPYRLSEDWLL